MYGINNSQVFLLVLYASFFVFSVFLSTILNFLLFKFASTLGIRNNANNLIRWSNVAKPALGGITFFIIYLIGLVFIRFFYDAQSTNNLRLMGIFFSIIIAFTLGLFDDAYDTKPIIKFLTQLLCGVILVATGSYVRFFSSDILNYSITLFWVVGIMNSINMLDNMDAITSIVALFILSLSLVCMYILGNFNDANFLVFVGLIGALISFLYFNWYPSKMYMGDTGSQFLGILLAVIGIKFFWNGPDFYGYSLHIKQFFMALIAFSLPIIDTTTVFIKRLSKGKSPFIGGKDHTTHHLAYLGLSCSQVALVFGGISLVSNILVVTILFISHWKLIYTIIYSLYFLTLFVVLFRIALMNRTDKK